MVAVRGREAGVWEGCINPQEIHSPRSARCPPSESLSTEIYSGRITVDNGVLQNESVDIQL